MNKKTEFDESATEENKIGLLRQVSIKTDFLNFFFHFLVEMLIFIWTTLALLNINLLTENITKIAKKRPLQVDWERKIYAHLLRKFRRHRPHPIKSWPTQDWSLVEWIAKSSRGRLSKKGATNDRVVGQLCLPPCTIGSYNHCNPMKTIFGAEIVQNVSVMKLMEKYDKFPLFVLGSLRRGIVKKTSVFFLGRSFVFEIRFGSRLFRTIWNCFYRSLNIQPPELLDFYRISCTNPRSQAVRTKPPGRKK